MLRLHRTEAAAAAALVAAGGLVLLQVVTYRPAVHGESTTLAASWALTVAGALLATGWALARRAPPWLAGLLVMAVVLPGSLVHAGRWRARQAPLQVVYETPPALRQAVEPTLRGASTLQLEPDGLVLRAPSGSVGYLEVPPLPTGEAPWDVPRALLAPPGADRSVGEEYAWRASAQLDGRYFVLLETDRLLVQLTPTGMLIDAPGRPSQRLVRPADWAAPQEWTLRRAGGRVTLSRGDEVVSDEDDAGPLRYLRLGETRSDDEHGGTLRLHLLRLRRFRA